jgi:hypothetical protein
MKYPMTFRVAPELDYPYRFRFDLQLHNQMPRYQIPELKNMVNLWLTETGIDYVYRQGLLWCLKNEQDAIMFQLRFA